MAELIVVALASGVSFWFTPKIPRDLGLYQNPDIPSHWFEVSFCVLPRNLVEVGEFIDVKNIPMRSGLEDVAVRDWIL